MARLKRKARKRKQNAKSPINALRELVDQPAVSKAHIRRTFLEMLRTRNDRGAAVLIATFVENELEKAIQAVLNIRPKQRSRLFGRNAPLASLSNKASLAFALDIIGPQTFENLEHIREIRNAFAHSKRHISFRTKQVRDVCGLLKMPKDISPWPWVKRTGNARQIFESVCFIIERNLMTWTGHALSPPVTKYPSDKWALTNRDWPNLPPMPVVRDSDLFLRRKPLP
jgi:mannitol operon repressor